LHGSDAGLPQQALKLVVTYLKKHPDSQMARVPLSSHLIFSFVQFSEIINQILCPTRHVLCRQAIKALVHNDLAQKEVRSILKATV
jgi:hypothetical protein